METRPRPTTRTISKTPSTPRLRWPVSERFQAIVEPTESEAVSRRLAPRQPHRKHRALARLARHRHVAAHHARELAGDGKAEAGSAVAARSQGIGLGEILEQFRLLLRRHTDAAIRDGKLDPVAAVRHLAHPQRDLALFRELAGIAQEIEQNLLEPHGIRGEGTQVLLRLDDEPVLVLLGELSGAADDLIDEPGPIDTLATGL